ncbi:hypothetical protein B0H67DRAFT_610429 [Lasiosphaeris hirsuta]|uniref:JmjC domain-containing protein n=1 Tax=Lasiosphaeris hirsuta TaxID=260670 RepID=A0AA40AGZ5_9PEZI|nr:hypothetical protein B0H67DRAFT_610429 [Lasiosphaeris hirsuta]
MCNIKAMTGSHSKLKTACLSAARGIQDECSATIGDASSRPVSQPDDESFHGCGEPLVQLLGRQASQLLTLSSRPLASKDGKNDTAHLILRRLEDIITASYARFYAYLFKELPVCWRLLYTDATILKFAVLYLSYLGDIRSQKGAEEIQSGLEEMVKTLDLALILAGGAGARRGRRWINEAFGLLEDALQARPLSSDDGSAEGHRPHKRRKGLPDDEEREARLWDDQPSFSTHEPFTPPVRYPIKRTDPISLEAFQAYMTRQANPSRPGPLPLVITGLTTSWPARTTHPWCKPAYLLSRTLGGRRLVPVELGRSYVDAGWGQKIIPLAELLHTHIDPPAPGTTTPTTTAYLAQHPLLSQLPALRADVLIPDYCYSAPPGHPTDPSQDQPELDAPQLNAWLGPAGTITPLHTDPYHNLLVQVVGRKYVRLYAPWETGRMRARGREGGVEMGNTSEVDVGVVEGWDDDEGGRGEGDEGFSEVPFLDCILEPGNTLYIPIGWWHYVRGLSVSFSVSFWWN